MRGRTGSVLAVLGVVCLTFVTHHGLAQEPIRVIAASATSSSPYSLPVTQLLDTAGEGLWKPLATDTGTDEGLFFQFETPVPMDFIEVSCRGDQRLNLIFYLDGQFVRPKRTDDDSPSDRLWYQVGSRKQGDGRIYRLGAYSLQAEALAPLKAKVQSVFIRLDETARGARPEVTAVRFFRQGSPKPLQVEVPGYAEADAAATSTLAPETAYTVHNLFDTKLDFAWATDGKKTTGVGERVRISLPEPIAASGLLLWNGYQRSATHYKANARPSKLKVILNGETEFTLSVQDKMGMQRLMFPEPAAAVREIVLEVLGIYPGGSYKDMVLSELKLLDAEGKILLLHTPGLRIEPPAGKLGEMLDVSYATFYQGIGTCVEEALFGSGYPLRRIRLRSNGSFVIYIENRLVMEGNWEPIAGGVRIFGKKYYTDPMAAEYLQAVKSQTQVSIFQAQIQAYDLAKTSFDKVKSHYRPILADRDFYEYFAKEAGQGLYWLTGSDPEGKAPITGKSESELTRRAFDAGARQGAILLSSPQFTDVFLPTDRLVQTYGMLP